MQLYEINQKIQDKINFLVNQISIIKIPYSINDAEIIINLYSELLDILSGRSNLSEIYIKLLQENPSADNINFYLQTLCTLKNNIDNLPFEEAIKNAMLGKLSEQCNLRLLTRFEKTGSLSSKEIKQVFATVNPESYIDTVQVKTWGTKREEGNGFRNVLFQQLRGEGFGHASLTMRVKADKKGYELIKKYCQNEDGSVKIPYENKLYGKESVYEIYWSYWPSGLSTLQRDIRNEHSNVEAPYDVEILSSMPLELRSRYLFQKYTKELPLLNVFNAEEKPLFSSNLPGFRKMGLLVDSVDASKVEPDIFRRNYLDLKVQQSRVAEEIDALDVLIDNYLTKDKAFNKNRITDKRKITSNSNFLILLQRFLPQLNDPITAAQVLFTHEITSQQAEKLESQILKLKDNKQDKRNELDNSVFQSAALLQENYAEFTLLRDEIEELKNGAAYYRRSIEKANAVIAILKKYRDCAGFSVLEDNDKEILSQFDEAFESNENASLILNKIIRIGSIELDEAALLTTVFENYKLGINKVLSEENCKLSSKTEQIQLMYEHKTQFKLDFIEKKLEDINLAQVKSEKALLHLEEFGIKISSLIETKQKLDLCKKAGPLAVAAIAEYLNSKKNPKVFEITYESINGPTTVVIKTFKQAIQVKKDIDAAAEGLKLAKNNIIQSLFTPDSLSNASRALDTKNKQESDRVEREACQFSYSDAAGVMHTKTIRNPSDLATIKSTIIGCQTSLEQQKNEVIKEKLLLKLERSTSIDDLNQRVCRSSTNDALLRGFDIEKMLERASDIVNQKTSFSLATENCSTKSMELLQAGAPSDVGFMFDWHRPKADETIPSNVFLTNPQAVYSSAKIVENAAKGDLVARAIIDQKRTQLPPRSYNTFLNELIYNMTTKTGVKQEPIYKNWSLYLKFLPYVYQLYCDIFSITKLKQEEVSTSLEAQVAQELRALNAGDYLVIDSTSPSFALYKLSELLSTDKKNIPFLNSDTLARVEQYILSLQAQESQTEFAINAMKQYHDLIAERDNRVQCLENAVLAGEVVEIQLQKRVILPDTLTWTMSNTEKVEALVNAFIYKYQEIRNENFFSFLTSNFINWLENCDSMQVKLERIKQQIDKYPNSRSARALTECLAQAEILKTPYDALSLKSQVNVQAYTFFKPEVEKQIIETELLQNTLAK